MKKILLGIFLLPLMFGFSSKNVVKTETFAAKSPSFALVRSEYTAEDFLSFWANFRESHEVCDITKEQYEEIYSNYSKLSNSDKVIVNNSDDKDEGYKIGDVIRMLNNKYYPSTSKMKNEKKKLDQSSVIVIASVVALVGATAISVLFILKNNKVIK